MERERRADTIQYLYADPTTTLDQKPFIAIRRHGEKSTALTMGISSKHEKQ
jgi:hypothetical protein